MALPQVSAAEVRPMRPDEWEVARDLLCDAAEQYPASFDVHPDAIHLFGGVLVKNFFVGDSDGVFRQTFFAEAEGRIVGMVVATRMTEEELELAGLYVCAHEQGKGMGTKMIRTVVDHALGLGVQSVYLRVTNANPDARELYIREGFSPEWPPEIQRSEIDPTIFVEKLVRPL